MPQSEIVIFKHQEKSFASGGASHDGKGNFTAYEGDRPGILKTWHGDTLMEFAPGRVEIVETYRDEFGDDSTAQLIRLSKERGWLVVYSLGQGMLVRGELLEHPHNAPIDDYDYNDARNATRSIAEYWIDKDASYQQDLEEAHTME